MGIGDLQLAIRAALVPSGRIAALVPDGARALDLGCGNGLVTMAYARRAALVHGIDYDERKTALARTRLEGFKNVTIATGDINEALAKGVAGGFDTAVISDTLASIPFQQQEAILARLAVTLQKPGRIIIKIIDTRPRWKFWCALLIASAVYKLLGLSRSHEQCFFHRPAAWYADELVRLGFTVRITPMHRLALPHVVIEGRRGDKT